MDYTLLTTDAELSAIASEWEALHARAGHAPFTSHAWIAGWWRFMGQPAGCRLHVMTGRREERLVAVAPLAVSQRRGIRLLGWAGSEVCDYADFLLEDGRDAAPLWQAVRKSREYDVALMREVHPQASCLEALSSFARPSNESYAHSIRFDAHSIDMWLLKLPYVVRKKYRSRLKQAVGRGALNYHVMTQAADAQGPLKLLIAQKTAWLNTRGKRHSYGTVGVDAFFRHIVETESSKGTMHMSTLSCGDEVIATHLGFVMAETFYSYMSSYNAEWAAVSPGILMLFECVSWAMQNGCKEFDFMRGDEHYKRVFANHARTLKDFTFARTLAGRMGELFYLHRQKVLPRKVS